MDVTKQKLFEKVFDYDYSNSTQTQMIGQVMKELSVENFNSLRIHCFHWALTCNIFIIFAILKDLLYVTNTRLTPSSPPRQLGRPES